MAALVENRQQKMHLDLPRVRHIVNSILRLLAMDNCELSVLFVDDDAITRINSQYLHRNHPTNVISFSMREGEFGDINPHVLGDVIISVETAQRDAEREGIPFEDELDYLMIHGILHLVGYDHETAEADAAGMKKKEDELFFEIKKYSLE